MRRRKKNLIAISFHSSGFLEYNS